jgi:mitogen-activated protein kinase 8 interacting protein 3
MAEILEDDNASPAVSERVQSLAKSVYEELEVFVNNYGQESINSLMPLIINILENLDSALSDNQDNLNAVLELNEENQQLVTQYEKEKHQRKEIEEKSLQLETANEEEIAVLKETVSSLKLEVKTCSNKIKNQNEQIEKLDERNEDLKAKNNELHEKNLELIRKQMEAMRDVASSIRAGGARSRDEESSTPTVRAPGFQDFTSSDNTKQKKKRFQPTLPAGIIQSPPVPMEGFIDNEEELIGLTPAAFLTSPVERSNMAELQDEYESEDEYPELK